MKKLIGIIFVSLAIAAVYAFVNTNVLAESCTPIYGYGQQCAPGVNIAVNKLIANPQSGSFVDNLGINDPKHVAEQTVNFNIIVTNTGSTNIAHVEVKDVFPQFINFISGPGNFDNNTKTLTFEVTSLNVGESRTFALQGKVVPENSLPADQGIMCVTNQAFVATNEGKTSADNAQLCIERKVLGGQTGKVVVFPPSKVTQIPATGVSIIQLLILAPTTLIGFILRKKALK